jgi:hypothetical protein
VQISSPGHTLFYEIHSKTGVLLTELKLEKVKKYCLMEILISLSGNQKNSKPVLRQGRN